MNAQNDDVIVEVEKLKGAFRVKLKLNARAFKKPCIVNTCPMPTRREAVANIVELVRSVKHGFTSLEFPPLSDLLTFLPYFTCLVAGEPRIFRLTDEKQDIFVFEEYDRGVFSDLKVG